MDAPLEKGLNAQRTDFGDQLRRFREAAGLTQELLADRAALTPNAVGALERGTRRHPYPATVRSLANALGLTDDEHSALAALIPMRRDRNHVMNRPVPGLPMPSTSLIGREREVAEIAGLLRDERARLITLTGPGGVGKTRLSLAVGEEVAGDFAGGVLFVDLTSIREVAHLMPTIAERLGIQAAGRQKLTQTLATAIGQRDLLLILDNVEQIPDAGVEIWRLLAANDCVRMLVTSRTLLRISGEVVYPVPPLALPGANDLLRPDLLADFPAVRLYADRAHAADIGFQLTTANAATIAAICHRLDGLPLAIELAAARARHLSPTALLARLAHQMPLLTFGARDQPERQQTMRDAIGWSYELLPGDQQQLFRRLSVFAGSFSLEAAESMMSETMGAASRNDARVLDGVAALVDANLLKVRPDINGMPYFRMLETMREYGQEQLIAAGEEMNARHSHASYFAGLDQRLHPNRVDSGERVDDRLWRIETDYPNLRSALEHMEAGGNAVGVLRLAGTMAIFWHLRGHIDEGRRWLEWALVHSPDQPSPERARALAGLSLVIWSEGEVEPAIKLAQASRIMAEEVDDSELIALSIHLQGIGELVRGDSELACQLMEDALDRWLDIGSRSEAAAALDALSIIAFKAGDVDLSARRVQEANALFREAGHPSGIAMTLVRIARLARDRGKDRVAAQSYREALELWGDVDSRWSSTMAPIDQTISFMFPRWASINDRSTIIEALTGLAGIAAAIGQPEQAAVLIGAIAAHVDNHAPEIFSDYSAEYDRTMSATCDALGEERFFAMSSDGRGLSLQQAIELAMQIPMPDDFPDLSNSPDALISPNGLTRRELEVLRLLAKRWSNKEIADALFISTRTVTTHVTSIFTKLGVQSRREAAVIADRDGLV